MSRNIYTFMKTTQIHLASSIDCTACAACENVCVHNAITMSQGHLGHLFPVVDYNKCVQCGICTKVCPIINPVELGEIRKAYAAWAVDSEEYKTSVSGGIASVISRYVIRNNGVVYGCAVFSGAVVKHIRVDNEPDLLKLKGSKYVQSDIRDAISQIKVDVKKQKLVLFIGTPCQVAAIKQMFKVQPSNLWLIDLICHGVPSVAMLKKYINRIGCGIEKCDNIIFRENSCYSLKLMSRDNKILYRKELTSQVLGGDLYLSLFHKGFINRESCYSCIYANSNRVGDITIGDFWGLGRLASVDKMESHPEGCSVVLPITDLGEKIVELIKNEVKCYERPINEAVQGNTQLKHPVCKTLKIRLYRQAQGIIDFIFLYKILSIDVFIIYWIKKIIGKTKKTLSICKK